MTLYDVDQTVRLAREEIDDVSTNASARSRSAVLSSNGQKFPLEPCEIDVVTGEHRSIASHPSHRFGKASSAVST